MDIQGLITKTLNDEVQQKIAGQTGLDSDSVSKIISIGAPLLLGSLGKNTSTEEGASSLDSAINEKHDGSLLDNLGDLFTDNDSSNSDGAKILGHIFGSQKEDVEEKVGTKTGVDAASVAKVLSFVAPVVLAQLGKQKAASNLDSNGLADLLQGQKSSSGNSVVDLISQFIDSDDDGNVLDDILGFMTKGGTK